MTAKRSRPRPMPPELQLALQLGVALLMLLAGGVITASTLGIIPPDESAGPVARLIAFLCGVATLLGGVWMLVGPLLVMAGQVGARDPFSAAALGCSRLLARIDLRSAGAAALLAPLAWDYVRSLQGRSTLLWSRQGLIDLILIEFLLIHGFVFLVLAVSLARVPEPWPRRAGIVGTALLALMYGAFAWGAGGIVGVVDLAYLTAPNLLAFARPQEGPDPRITAGSRWVVKLFCFFAVAILMDERTLQGEGNLEIGAVYFALMVLVELFRVAEIPLDLAATWSRVPPHDRKLVAIDWSQGS